MQPLAIFPLNFLHNPESQSCLKTGLRIVIDPIEMVPPMPVGLATDLPTRRGTTGGEFLFPGFLISQISVRIIRIFATLAYHLHYH